ncbi:hypothetical protein FOFC_04470 [Fusarium oxysporum]|nr:hypothetical protein FOFC_04470 [Fusarium oxysporum]
MAPQPEKSQLKRPRGSLPDDETETKKPRRAERLEADPDKTPIVNKQHLPSPLTHLTDDSNELNKEPTATPPGQKQHEITPKKTEDTYSQGQALSSPPQDTQPLSQFVDRHPAISDDIEDEIREGVWGYLVPLDPKYGDKPIVLKKRSACPLPDTVADSAKQDNKHHTNENGKSAAMKDEEAFEKKKEKGVSSGGYLIGRHPECDIVVNDGIVSNRHCLIFTENKGNDTVAIVEDLSSNGTYVNEAIVGRNQRRELEEQDEIAVHGKARFVFRYPQSRQTSAFLQQYTLLEKLGKGHFAEVYLCVEKATGQRFAVKIFTKHPGVEDRSKTEGLQQEIGVLMGVSHPNVLCLKDTFNERDRVYLVLELAPEGELFNYIVMKQKLSEDESRKLFVQLFQGIKYLQIKSGRFDYPSPYWDSVGDPALDLIDSMLIVDPEKRFTIDQCLQHPWLTHSSPGVNDSTGGLVGGIAGLEVNRRAPARERTLLASLNTVQVTAQLEVGKDKNPVKVFSKNKGRVTNIAKESDPAAQRAPDEFIEMGGKGDQELFADDDSSIYPIGDNGEKIKANKAKR